MLSERLTLVRNDVDERFPHDGWKGELRGEFSIEIFLHDPACSDQTIRCQRTKPLRMQHSGDEVEVRDHAPNGWLLREEL
jgi:hypothetical protein